MWKTLQDNSAYASIASIENGSIVLEFYLQDVDFTGDFRYRVRDIIKKIIVSSGGSSNHRNYFARVLEASSAWNDLTNKYMYPQLVQFKVHTGKAGDMLFDIYANFTK